MTATKRVLAAGGSPRLYAVWNAMNARCHNPNNKSFRDYGGRGITVCDRWRRRPNNPEAFWNFFVDMGNPPPGLSIDRFPDNDGGYSLDNVRWATAVEQARNQRPGHIHPNAKHQQWVKRMRAEKQAAATHA